MLFRANSGSLHVHDGLKFLLRYAFGVLTGVLYGTELYFMGKKR